MLRSKRVRPPQTKVGVAWWNQEPRWKVWEVGEVEILDPVMLEAYDRYIEDFQEEHQEYINHLISEAG